MLQCSELKAVCLQARILLFSVSIVLAIFAILVQSDCILSIKLSSKYKYSVKVDGNAIHFIVNNA